VNDRKMRFKAVLLPQKSKLFIDFLHALQKVDPVATFRLNDAAHDHIFIAANIKLHSMMGWVCFHKSAFASYRIESMAGNEIGFDIDIDSMLIALKIVEPSSFVTLKLVKRGGGTFLSVDISVQVGARCPPGLRSS